MLERCEDPPPHQIDQQYRTGRKRKQRYDSDFEIHGSGAFDTFNQSLMCSRLLLDGFAQMSQGKNQRLPGMYARIGQNILGTGNRLRRIRHEVRLQAEYHLELTAYMRPFLTGKNTIVSQNFNQHALQFEIDTLQPDHHGNVGIDRG